MAKKFQKQLFVFRDSLVEFGLLYSVITQSTAVMKRTTILRKELFKLQARQKKSNVKCYCDDIFL